MASIVVTLVGFIPLSARRFENMAWSGMPRPFEQAVDASEFVRYRIVYLMPALVLLLWLDWKVLSVLRRHNNTVAATVWSVVIFAVGTVCLVWLWYALATPDIAMHRIHEAIRLDFKP